MARHGDTRRCGVAAIRNAHRVPSRRSPGARRIEHSSLAKIRGEKHGEGMPCAGIRHGGRFFFPLFLFLLRIARAKGSLGRLRYSLYVPPYLDRALLFEYGTGEMTSAEYQSHREAGRIFIDCYLDSDDAGSAERVWSAFCYCARSL